MPYVGIGTASPQAALDIQGVVRIGNVTTPTALATPGYALYVQYGVLAESFKVAQSSDLTNWSDYVFDKDYKLPPLSYVENYIKDNKHLPMYQVQMMSNVMALIWSIWMLLC